MNDNLIRIRITFPRGTIERAIKGTNLTYEQAVAILRDGKQIPQVPPEPR